VDDAATAEYRAHVLELLGTGVTVLTLAATVLVFLVAIAVVRHL
jgi:hypothetical protein